jgi:hypothetical protein
MRDQKLHRARIVASVAATVISLACGTNVGIAIIRTPHRLEDLANSICDAVRLFSMGTPIRRAAQAFVHRK